MGHHKSYRLRKTRKRPLPRHIHRHRSARSNRPDHFVRLPLLSRSALRAAVALDFHRWGEQHGQNIVLGLDTRALGSCVQRQGA